MIAPMPRRSHARYLAPLAVVAFFLALTFTLLGSGGGEEPASGPAQTAGPATTPAKTAGAGKKARKKREKKNYVVKPGDTPSGIAEKHGVTLEDIEQLNPEIDPQTLTPGQRIRLRQ